jgi:hypothetical protein
MTESPSNPTVEVLPPENPPNHDLFAFWMMHELVVIWAMLDLLDQEGDRHA